MKRSYGLLLASTIGLSVSGLSANATVIGGYEQTNLVSNLALPGVVQDTNLQNPWGVSESATSPLWISDQAANVATLYTIGPTGLTATPAGGTPPLVVSIPTTSSGPQGPTGQISNPFQVSPNTAFEISSNTSPSPTPAHFIFANLNGTISAWANSATPAAIEDTLSGAVFTGLAVGSVAGPPGTSPTPYLYAANGGASPGIDVFNGTFANVTGTTFAGKFVDPNLPAGYVPFNVQNIGGQIYVAYAPATIGPDRTPQTEAIAGQGFVDIYDTSGNLVKRLISGSALAAPWGLALAPAGFGTFGGDLLVGNFAYGTNPTTDMVNPAGGEINVFDPNTGAFLDTLDIVAGWEGLWALTFGNGGSGGNPDILYFTTGLNAETNGLFGAVSFVPEPSGLALLATALALLGIRGWRFRSQA